MPSFKIGRFFLFFFLWTELVFSQNFPSKNYTAAKELPNNTVRALLFDSDHILWIGTANGVVKKENDVFTHFFEEDGLALNSCWAIAEDSDNKLWFGSYGGGVSIYDGNEFKVLSVEDGLVHNEITKLVSFGDHMFVGTSNGVSVIDVHTLEVHSLETPGRDLFRIQDFFKYRNEIFVVTYNSGIYKISDKKGQKVLEKVNDYKYVYSVFVENDSIFSSNKEYFTKAPLEDYLKKEAAVPPKQLGHSIIWDYVKTEHKIFAAAWGIYGSNGGLYEVAGEELISRASDFEVPSREVISLAYDAAFEKLYVGTMDAGLFEIEVHPRMKFTEIPEKNVLEFARTGKVTALLLNDALILRSAEKELRIGLPQLKKWQQDYILTTGSPFPTDQELFYELDHSTPAINIRFYDLKVGGDIFWINTNIGLFAIKESGELDRYLALHSEEINFTEVGHLIETHPYGGVRVYGDLENLKYRYFKPADPHTPTMVVNSLRRADKTYLLSVFSGMYVWEEQQFKSYLHEGIWNEKQLKHITTLGKDLAVSNEFGDVFIINDEVSFELLKKIPRAKIQGNSISFLKEYQGSLLIGTEKGLTVIDNDRFIFLDEEQGLTQPFLSAEVNGNSLLIGSNTGYYTLDLEGIIQSEALVDQIKLKEILINNEKFPLRQLEHQAGLKLEHNKNTVLLRYQTNAHPNPHKLIYQYRLNREEAWSLPSPKSEIFLPFLPADDYDVEVKVLDQSTGLNYTQSLLKLSVLPPFWWTWWFLLLATSLMFLLIYCFYQFQIKQTRKFEAQKGLIQKRVEETKMEALLAQMNPHFTFNAMNSVQNYIINNDTDSASLFLSDFAKLIRLNLDHCTKPTILLVEEIEYLESYVRVENTRFNNKIHVIFEVDPLIDPYELEIPTMLLQSFVENVFVHAFPPGITDPTLKVEFKMLSSGLLQCRIEDNGIGFSSNSTQELHESKGVALVKERLALLGYTIEKAVQIISAKNKGTTVIIELEV